jgi:hypothetical protein
MKAPILALGSLGHGGSISQLGVGGGKPLNWQDLKFSLILIVLGSLFVASDLWFLRAEHWAAGPRGLNAGGVVVGLIMVVCGIATLLGYKPSK